MQSWSVLLHLHKDLCISSHCPGSGWPVPGSSSQHEIQRHRDDSASSGCLLHQVKYSNKQNLNVKLILLTFSHIFCSVLTLIIVTLFGNHFPCDVDIYTLETSFSFIKIYFSAIPKIIVSLIVLVVSVYVVILMKNLSAKVVPMKITIQKIEEQHLENRENQPPEYQKKNQKYINHVFFYSGRSLMYQQLQTICEEKCFPELLIRLKCCQKQMMTKHQRLFRDRNLIHSCSTESRTVVIKTPSKTYQDASMSLIFLRQPRQSWRSTWWQSRCWWRRSHTMSTWPLSTLETSVHPRPSLQCLEFFKFLLSFFSQLSSTRSWSNKSSS